MVLVIQIILEYRKVDLASAGRYEAGRSFDQEDRRPAGCRGEDPDPPVGPPPRQTQGAGQTTAPVLGLGLEAIQGMTNAMNAVYQRLIQQRAASTCPIQVAWIKRMVNLSCGFFGVRKGPRTAWEFFLE